MLSGFTRVAGATPDILIDGSVHRAVVSPGHFILPLAYSPTHSASFHGNSVPAGTLNGSAL